MISKSHVRSAAACLAALGLLGMARDASAINCSDVGGAGAHRIYLTGSTAARPVIATLGKALATAANPIFLVYVTDKGSCDGVHAMLDDSPLPLTSTGNYYVPADYLDGGAAPTCQFNSEAAQIGVSDVYFNTCADFKTQTTLKAGIGDFLGPNQVMEFIVPAQSSQKSISAQGAYLLFGFGNAVTTYWPTSPWNDITAMWIRSAASGTQSMLAKAINVSSDKWKGTGNASGGAVLTGVDNANANQALAEKTIGILAADVADAHRKNGTMGVTTLAYQHYGQKCMYLPDSSSTSYDKANVRDGHYPIFGPIHFLTKVDAGGVPTDPAVKQVLDYITEKAEAPASILDAEIDAHTIPQCAMKVTRSAEIGPYTPLHPAKPCGCYFEKRLGGGASCTACTTDATCTGGTFCSHGYCEAK